MSSELLPKAPSGGSSFAQWLQSLTSFVRSSRIIESPDVKPTITSQGTVLRIKRGAGGPGGEPGTLGRYLVTGIFDDHITATEQTSGTEHTIAKPWRLTRTPFDGQSLSFTDEQGRSYTATYSYFSAHRRRVGIVTGSGVQIFENQVIIPRYAISLDYIYAMTVEGGTGVDAATLLDVNTDGRAWARER